VVIDEISEKNQRSIRELQRSIKLPLGTVNSNTIRPLALPTELAPDGTFRHWMLRERRNRLPCCRFQGSLKQPNSADRIQFVIE
jgi:hypothetical protein